MKILQQLHHPRLVAIIGAAYTQSELCIVLEFMSRGNLHNLLHVEKYTLVVREMKKISFHVVEGIKFLHHDQPSGKPAVHRDLKSMNVVLDRDLNAKICDFGLAQSMENTHITRKEQEGGSPRYMAPELFDSCAKLTEKVDVWAVGCLIAEIFSGRPPHEECTSLQQVMAKLLIKKLLPFSHRPLNLDVQDSHVLDLIEGCLRFETQERSSALDLYEKFLRLNANVD